MDRTPQCGPEPIRESLSSARHSQARVERLRLDGLKAHDRAASICSVTAAMLDRERERMHQFRIDAEIAATEREIQRLPAGAAARNPRRHGVSECGPIELR